MNALTILTEINLDDLVSSFGWENSPLLAHTLRRIFVRPARKFARQMLDFDDAVGRDGLANAARIAQHRYVRSVRLFSDPLPAGPFLALSNHPGMVDTLALFSALNRPDSKIIAVDRPFLKGLPNTSKKLFYVTDDPSERMSLVRQVSGHLRSGGAALTFPAGEIEPDANVYPGAVVALAGWTDSVGVLVRMAPETAILPVLVRGVIWEKTAKHPLMRLKKMREEREKQAAALQLLAHVVLDKKPLDVTVQIGKPITVAELGSKDTKVIHQVVLAEMRRLIENPPEGDGVSVFMSKKTLRILRTLAVYTVLGLLLWWALRAVPLIEIWYALKQLTLWQIGILLLLNALVLIAMTARWWVILRVENPNTPFLQLVRYRLAVFGLSYFTPGPQVGGEPLQVIYLQRKHGISFARATAAVIMDKLLEFLANFILLGIGLTAAIRVGVINQNSTQAIGSLIPLAAILLWPLMHLVLLYRGRYPISAVVRAAMFLFKKQKWMRLIIVSERMAGAFTRRHPIALFAALGFSLLSWAGMAAEYFMMADFLQAQLTAEQTLAALTAALFAFLMPLPGGLGALEASQVYVMTIFGHPAAIGIGISLLMRARDVLNGGLGLLLAGVQSGKDKK